MPPYAPSSVLYTEGTKGTRTSPLIKECYVSATPQFNWFRPNNPTRHYGLWLSEERYTITCVQRSLLAREGWGTSRGLRRQPPCSTLMILCSTLEKLDNGALGGRGLSDGLADG
jgi:hypothetical protein